MQRPEVSVRVAVKPELTVRRPPRQLIDLLDQPEDSFRDYIQDIEDSQPFRSLVDAGIIRRVKSRGRMPRDKYEEYMDVQLMQFLRQHKIADQPGWEDDFRDASAMLRLEELAEKYHAPEPKLKAMIEYYQRITSEYYTADGYGRGGFDDEPDYVELVPSRADVDLTDSIVLLRDFVDQYGLDEEQFVLDFLADGAEPRQLAEKYGASLGEVREILEALGEMHIADTFVGTPPTTEATGRATAQPTEPARPVAKVLLTEQGRNVAVQFPDESVYAQRYRTSPSALTQIQDLDDRNAAEHLLLELQWINQRKTLLCRLVMASCNHQYRYFLTGDLYTLKPLSQADIARRLGEDEATICRLLRDKFVETPYGVIELKFLFQKKTEVVRRILERHPRLTDNEIRQILERDYDTKISRRTVAYHRLKFQRDHAREREPEVFTAYRRG